MTIKPFSPDEARENKKNLIPDEVIRAVNNLLSKNFSEGRIYLKKNEIVAEIERLLPPDKVFLYEWLNFEELYRDNGWHVQRDSPSYNESYETVYEFTRKNK